MRPVQCARCGASFYAVSGEAVACPSCGQPFANGAPQTSWPGAPASRPLNAGAGYPDPYGPPDAAPPAYQPGGQTHAWGAPVGPYDTADMGPQYQYQHIYDPEPEREPSDRGCRLASIIGVVLVVVIALGLVGVVYFGGPLNKSVTLSPTPTLGPSPTATLPPVPSGFTRYSDSSHLFSMGVPSEWTDVSNQVTGTDTLPSGTHFIIFLDEAQDALLEVIDAPGDASAIDGVETRGLGANSNYAVTLSNQSGPNTITLAGASWTQRAADQTASAAGLTIHLVIIGTTRDHHDIFIEYGALSSAFPTLNETMFQQALGSFAFTQ